MKRTLRHPKGVDDGLHQAQHEEGAGAHVGQEEHDADASSELRTHRSADHVWETLRKRVGWIGSIHVF